MVRCGEFVALIGPSGSLNHTAITKLRNHSSGFVFQYHYLISVFTAIENVMIPLLVDHAFQTNEMNRRARDLLAQVGLTQWENNLANNMSGGQQQRVAFARALAMNLALILADESIGKLDTKSANTVFEMMQHVNQTNRTTHSRSLRRRQLLAPVYDFTPKGRPYQ